MLVTVNAKMSKMVQIYYSLVAEGVVGLKAHCILGTAYEAEPIPLPSMLLSFPGSTQVPIIVELTEFSSRQMVHSWCESASFWAIFSSITELL